MDFGKITDAARLDRIHWSLPPLDTPLAQAQYARLKRSFEKNPQPQRIHVGLPVWGEAEWVGNLYPSKTKPENFLREYAKQFSTVEVNSTFYAIPPKETLTQWAQAVSEPFQFCPKFPQTISRELHLSLNIAGVQAFAEAAKVLLPHLGPCFLQLPPTIGIESLPRLNALFQQLPKFLNTVVEFRHESFFQERRLRPEVIDLLARHSIGTVVLDTALYRELSHESFSAPRILVRFLGSDLHPSDLVRLDQWAERVRVWYQSGMKEIYFFVHQPHQTHALKSAEHFIHSLNRELAAHGIPLQIPSLQLRAEEQGSLL